MSEMGRIPIRWKDRWSRFRHTTLPAVSFLACVALTFWLWIRQAEMPRVIGELETVRLQIASGTGGVLASLPQGPWKLCDAVEADQVIAQFDDRVLRAQMATLTEDLHRLGKELDAAGAKLAVSEADRIRSSSAEAARLQFELEQRGLTALQTRLQLEVDRLKAEQANTTLECMKPLHEKKMVSDLEMNNARMARDEAAKRLSEDRKVSAEAETQRKQAEARLRTTPALVPADVQRELAPIAAAAEVQKTRIRELEIKIGRLTVRAPITGRICAVYHWPNEEVRAGDPIVAMAAEKSRYIIGFVRQDQRFTPKVGMAVEVRGRTALGKPVRSIVECVGPQIEAMPAHLCRDPKVPEWGLPVRIALPDGFAGRPGELFEINFQLLPESAS
jgi:multidrug resistance efflux pump